MASRDRVEAPRHSIPPYVPYRTFATFVEGLKSGVPSHIDKSVLKSMSGGVQGWLKASLRAMDLIDSASAPRSTLHKLAAAEGGARQRMLRELFTSTYAFLSPRVDLAVTTPAQVETAFMAVGASGDTVRKCVAFMLALAKDGGVELSPHLLKRRAPARRKRRVARGLDVPAVPTSVSGAERRSATALPAVAPSHTDDADAPPDDLFGQLLRRFPEFDPGWNDELKAKWFAAFERLLGARGR